jgi:hypothetical protein
MLAAVVTTLIATGKARANDCLRKVGEHMPPIKAVDDTGKSITITAGSG